MVEKLVQKEIARNIMSGVVPECLVMSKQCAARLLSEKGVTANGGDLTYTLKIDSDESYRASERTVNLPIIVVDCALFDCLVGVKSIGINTLSTERDLWKTKKPATVPSSQTFTLDYPLT